MWVGVACQQIEHAHKVGDKWVLTKFVQYLSFKVSHFLFYFPFSEVLQLFTHFVKKSVICDTFYIAYCLFFTMLDCSDFWPCVRKLYWFHHQYLMHFIKKASCLIPTHEGKCTLKAKVNFPTAIRKKQWNGWKVSFKDDSQLESPALCKWNLEPQFIWTCFRPLKVDSRFIVTRPQLDISPAIQN